MSLELHLFHAVQAQMQIRFDLDHMSDLCQLVRTNGGAAFLQSLHARVVVEHCKQ